MMEGKKHSIETREKIRIKALGRKHTEESKIKMSRAHKGKKLSIKTKERISKTKKRFFKEGKTIPSNLGKKLPIETRKKMSDTMKKQYKEGKRISYIKGKKHKRETKEKISKKLKGIRRSKKTIDKIKENRINQILPLKDTKIELRVQNFLKELGIEFVTHKYIKDIRYGYQCDIFIPVQRGINQKTIIECDGDYWHGNLEKINISKLNKTRLNQRCLDYERTAQLKQAGFRVIRLWESEINKIQVEEMKQILVSQHLIKGGNMFKI